MATHTHNYENLRLGTMSTAAHSCLAHEFSETKNEDIQFELHDVPGRVMFLFGHRAMFGGWEQKVIPHSRHS